MDKLEPIRVGALFMEQGTGKSRTAIEMVARRRARIDKVLWFCPFSIKDTIRAEIEKHSAGEVVYLFNGVTSIRNLPEAFWYIIGIESMSASRRIILAVNALVTEQTKIIVDESQFIKGHRAARTDWITRVSKRARYRLILTGTPISQGVVDLFAQMRFLSPKILGYTSFYSFARNHLVYSDKFPGKINRVLNTEYLAARIQPYAYQVTKEECFNLPPKKYETRRFYMTDEQEQWYERIKEETLFSIVGYDYLDKYFIFRLFNLLQQIVSGFLHRDGKRIEFSHNRIDKLLDTISDRPPAEKIIIWAKFIFDIESISAALEREFGSGSVSMFYGKNGERRRNEELARFRTSARFLVGTPSCAGHGLTLNESSYVIFYNNSFKYVERVQAEDRNHRLGQSRTVTYIDLICSGSIDNRIMTALQNKGSVVDEFKREVDAVKNNKPVLESMIRGL
ncbi:MAG: DEAD/DEAH box helicase [Desulfovibrionaceae bacterium]|nr:DEAD/DEAH box helicase [Desulfovibrionaceae bacterium]